MAGLAACSDDTRIAPPKAQASDTSDARLAAAQATVADLGALLRDGDRAAVDEVGVPALRPRLLDAIGNVARLHLADLAIRYVDDVPASTVSGTAEFGPTSWQAVVGIDYRLSGWDDRTTHVETTLTFVPAGAGLRIAAIGAADGRTPLWLSGPVTPITHGRTLVLARSGADGRDSRLAQRAVRDVNLVLPRWRGRLVVEAPASEEEFDRTLGATQAQYADIAAVTASVDGSLTPGSPVHVFLNPAVFGRLGPRAAQVVISHESTHVATGATFVDMPTWLLEGFADYVALAHAGIPVRTAAAQILRRIRTSGIPTHLPTDQDLGPTAPGLGATYEEAWLATRSLARAYGEKKLVALYETVSAGTKIDAGFSAVLHTTQAAFVARWRADLRALSAAVAG